MSHRQAVVFDVNETMLDLGALDPLFVEWFGDSGASRGWFAQTLHLAITLAAIRTFRNFGEIGVAALAMEAQRRDVALPDDFPARLREAVLRLPAYRDVASALSLLRDAGLTTAALTNNPLPVVQEQLTYAGIAGLFDEIMSVDEAGVLKPAPEVYAFAAERLDLPPYSVLVGCRARVGHRRGDALRVAGCICGTAGAARRSVRAAGNCQGQSD